MDVEFEKLDVTHIEDHEWAKNLRTYVLDHMDQCVLNWCKIVIELGHEELELDAWLSIFKRCIEERCKELVVDVSDMKLKVLESISELMERSENYCRQLNMDNNLREVDPNNGYYLTEKQLLRKVKILESMINERKEQLNNLIGKQQKLCTALEEAPYEITTSPLPSKEKVEELQRYIETLEQEKFDREEKYFNMKENIAKMAMELNLVPKTDFEKEILSDGKESYNIGKSNMERMEKFQVDLSNQINNMKEEINALRERVDSLWTILEESMTERDSFHDKYSTYSVETLKALKNEVKRCEDLKKANIKIFVDKLRVELKSLWRTCYQHNDEDDFLNYPWFTTDFYTEDLLTYHEMEVNKWKAFYSRNKELMNLLSEHQKLWNRLLEMQNKDLEGLNRYKNRGGELLKEEKERNKLSKKIPLIEEKIKELAKDYENYHGQEFQYFGTPILEHIDNLHNQRDAERKIKLSARKQIREKEPLTPAKSYLNLFPSSSRMLATPLSATKRKIYNIQTTGKKTKISEKTSFKTSTLSNSKLNRSRRLSREKNKRMVKCRKLLQMKDNKNKENLEVTRMTDYDDFESGVFSLRSAHRSTQYAPVIDTNSKPVIIE
ncbi:hypothetical protein WA026_017811 [Henosepilachna vigintioctopunctata]|uniref:Protein regulator of cytokinesis 1 n=1 Tax=Henosepilachna vigintioctopunctata TaxID=420089 RepID=A0AAW1TUI7_9CUCU